MEKNAAAGLLFFLNGRSMKDDDDAIMMPFPARNEDFIICEGCDDLFLVDLTRQDFFHFMLMMPALKVSGGMIVFLKTLVFSFTVIH